MSRAGPLLAGLLAAVTAGCGIDVSPPRAAKHSPLAVAQATHEYPPAPSRPQHVAEAFASPVAAIDTFANAYINWTADTVAGQMQALARVSVGQARSAVQLAAAQTAGDYELQRDGIANSGQVEAVAPLAVKAKAQYVVVTRELTTATATTAYQGLAPAWHVAIATVAQLAPGEWAVSGWQPES